MRRTTWLTLFLVTGLILGGCGKDDKNPTSPEQQAESAAPQITFVNGPSSQNVPPVVARPVTALSAFGDLGQTIVLAVRDTDPTQTGGSYVWVYPSGEATFTITSNLADDGAHWQVKVSGVYDGKQVANLLLLKGFSSNDGSHGWIESYDPETGQKAARYEWNTSDNGTVHATLEVYGDPTVKYEVVNNSDGSGSLEMYEGNVKKLEASWQANGSGTYIVYDDSGNVADQGQWG